MNYNLFKAINQHAGTIPFLDWLMVFITQYAIYMYIVLFLVMWITGSKSQKSSVIIAGVTGLLAIGVNYLIGYFYFEPRPFITHPDVHLLLYHDADATFPSDHTTGAFALALALLLQNRKRIGIAMITLACLTAVSRIYVGHHYPSDVAGSLIVALIVSLFVYTIRGYLETFTIPFIQKLYKVSIWKNN
jgi:undecaprenyl-diphosphatase